ncbi:MAG: ATP-binding protein [Methanolobus sp.]
MKETNSFSTYGENGTVGSRRDSAGNLTSGQPDDYQTSCSEYISGCEISSYLRTSSSGDILEVNDVYCLLSGYSRGELLNMTLKGMDASIDGNNLPENLSDFVLKSKGHFYLRHRTKEGNKIVLDVSATCVDRECFEIICVMKDITGLFNEEISLEQDDTYWPLFKENKAVMLVINPENFDIIDANIEACKYYGWSLEELTRMKIHEINTLSPEEIRIEMENAVSEKRNFFLFKHRLASGELRDVEVYSSPVNMQSRNYLYSIVHDITDRRRAEDDLKTREMQLRTAQNIGHIGSWCFDLNTGEADASDEARRIYGYGLGGGKYPVSEVQAIALPEYRPVLNDAMRALIHEDVPYNVQFKIKRPSDGAIRDVHVVAEYDENKNTLIGTVEDITDRKKAEDALLHAKIVAEEANKTKDEFLATMSHELRTPLTSVIGFSDVLLDETFGSLDDKQKRYVSHILDAGKHLLELINDVLDISKVEAGKMDLFYEDFNVSSAIAEVQGMVSPLAMEKHIGISSEIESKVENINADRTKFRQILYNLISNAIKFTPDKGSIAINARHSDGMLLVSVTDIGIGISKEDIDKLFHPFKQLDSYITQDSEGTGLGLSLVKKFVELHDGRVWVESDPGNGSTFTFSIPVKGKNSV